MSSIEKARGLPPVSRDRLIVHGDVAALTGGERHRPPVDTLAGGSAALIKRLRLRRMAEQITPWR
jgi:hypothetical protein